MHNVKVKAYAALACTSVFWGISWVLSKRGVDIKNGMPALQLASIRQIISGIIFLSIFSWGKWKMPTKKEFLNYLILSILLFVFSNGFSTWSVKYLSAGLGSLIGAMFPLCSVLLEYFFFNKNILNTSTIIGLLLGIAGISIVCYDNIVSVVLPNNFLLGIGLAVFAMLSWSIGTIILSQQGKKENKNMYLDMGYQMLLGGIILYIISAASGQIIAIDKIPLISWQTIAYLVCFGSIVGFFAFIITMKHLPIAVASLYAYINPLVALVIGAIFLNEPLTLKIIIGSLITLLGVYIVNASILKFKIKSS